LIPAASVPPLTLRVRVSVPAIERLAPPKSSISSYGSAIAPSRISALRFCALI
jgi:hypothetical protein